MTTTTDWRARADSVAAEIVLEHEWAIGNRDAVRLLVALAWMTGYNAGSIERPEYGDCEGCGGI